MIGTAIVPITSTIAITPKSRQYPVSEPGMSPSVRIGSHSMIATIAADTRVIARPMRTIARVDDA